LALAALLAPAQAALFVGFEAPDFAPGLVNGQSGWQTYANNTVTPLVATANPFGGTQHLRISGDDNLLMGDPIGAFSPTLSVAPAENSLLSVMVDLSSAGGASYEVIAQSLSEADVTARVQFAFTGDIWVLDDVGGGVLDFVDTNYDFAVGSYKQLRIEAVPGTGLSYYYDNSLIYSSAFFGGSRIEQGILQSDNYHAGDYGDFDNFRVIPEPAAGLMVLAALGLCRRR
jgi:hypothetical protein